MKKRILFVNQEITPYLPENFQSKVGRFLPQGIQEKGKEIRTFMPRFGNINERRNQLHEVIRLSGMNLIIDDQDHPLIIKVASIQQARMQVYFIDNEEFFHRKSTFRDKKGVFHPDNDERAVFYSRGVLETVKKLGWAPDIIHVHGWMGSMIPLYVKKAMKDNPLFADTKVVMSIYNDGFTETLSNKLTGKIKMYGIDDADLSVFEGGTYVDLMKGALQYSDAVIINCDEIDPAIQKMVDESGKPVLLFPGTENYIDTFDNFYNSLLEE
ncbi:MAG: glycogen/starch synthase [Bacteroidales bacterium]|jgi:starch synthase|nr:glycogen/starch synthase [Bacteroidales bacterium]